MDKRSCNTGGFFSLFGLQPRAFDLASLLDLGLAMASVRVDGPGAIPSGYVYLGQFIAHDVSRLQPVENESTPIKDLVQLRTPALDLDSVYAGGFNDPGIAVDPFSGRMRLGPVVTAAGGPGQLLDLPRRSDKTAIIGDDRNDENLLVAQLHVQFLRLHNYFVHRLSARDETTRVDPEAMFMAARRLTILHYQHVVLYDFLPVVISDKVWQHVILNDKGELWNPKAGDEARMPVEFSAAAFRFGHSLVRDGGYSLQTRTSVSIPELFAYTGSGKLNGHPALPDTHVVDWDLFFPNENTNPFFNFSQYFDPVVPLRESDGLPIAFVNMRTGTRSALPDAQELVNHLLTKHPKLSTAIGLTPLSREQLSPELMASDETVKPLLAQLPHDYGFDKITPLWYYLLAEALALGQGKKLGPLGSLIVAEVLRALIYLSHPNVIKEGCGTDYVKSTRQVAGRSCFSMWDLIQLAAKADSNDGRCHKT